MHALFESVFSAFQNPRFAAVWIDALIKSFVVLSFVGGVCLVWRRASAATRHLIWFLALLSLPLLPLLPQVLPTARHPLWTVSSELVSGNQIALSLDFAPAKSPAFNNAGATNPQNDGAMPATKNGVRVFTARVNHDWLAIGFAGWSGGILFMFFYSALGQFQLRRISRNARPLDTLEWTRLLAEACESLRLRRRIILLQSSENMMPLTWGWLRPKVMMPAEAKDWAEDRRRIVLLHELAHVKRRDCLTQVMARAIAALYWFNPLAWIAARQMCIERERACDDLVLNGGWKASDYASHLVQIAKAFRRTPQAAGIAMARASNLEQRVTAIVDASRSRRLRPMGLAGVLLAIAVIVFCIGSYKISFAKDNSSPLLQKHIAQLEEFSKQKLEQSKILAASAGETMLPEYQRLFDAATTGDIKTVTNLYHSFSTRHPQYNRTKGVRPDVRLRTSYWGPILEIDLAYDHVANCDPKYTEIAVNDMVGSIPRGAIYFGGTDPGRGLPTAFCKSHVAADPFYTLTQNALADSTYLDYLRNTYGENRPLLEALAAARAQDPELLALDKEYHSALDKLYDIDDKPDNDPDRKAADEACYQLEQKVKERTDQLRTRLKAQGIAPPQDPVLGPIPPTIYIPTEEDMQKGFQDYIQDAQARLLHDKQFPKEPKQVKSGEEIKVDENGHVQVSGQVAVMGVNANIAKTIFDKNPERDFYVEESFPLDWMYPHLEPHGLIMKINREPLAGLSEDVVQRDHDYWQNLANGMIGNWLTDETSVQAVSEFAEKVYQQKDLSGFTGDAGFISDNYAPKMFSKWRSSIAGVYVWRAQHASDPEEKQRMSEAADFAFKQAFALCPSSPEADYRYSEFLVNQKRQPDALLIAETASRLDPSNNQLKDLIRNLNQKQNASATLEKLKNRRIVAEAEHEQFQATLKILKALNHDDLEKALPLAVKDSELEKLFTERDIAERRIAEIKQTYGPQHPKYLSAEESVKDLQRKIDERMKGILVGIQVKVDSSAALLASLKGAIQDVMGSSGNADPTSL